MHDCGGITISRPMCAEPRPKGMGSHEEQVTASDFLHAVRMHVVSAYDYLTR